MIPTPRLWGALVALCLPALAGGFLPGVLPLVAAADLLLLLLAALDQLAARGVRLGLTRELPVRLSVGAANPVRLTLDNRSGRAVRVALRLELPGELAASPELLALRVPSQSRVRETLRLTPARRGRFGLGPTQVRVLGPLGLTWHHRRLGEPEEVSVYPDLRGAHRLILSGAAVDLAALGIRPVARDGRGSEFARLRDYTQGDSLRDVDWKATARRNRPVTRVLEAERSQRVMLCVDASRAMAARSGEVTRLDHAINAALLLAFVALQAGDRVGLCVFADSVKAYLPPQPGRLQYRRIVDVLYATPPQLTYADYPALFRELNTRLRRRSLLCLFGDHVDEEQTTSMLGPLRRLSRRHLPLCLWPREEGLWALLERRPEGADAAFQHAAASERLLEREGVKRAVARGGIQLLDVEPERLPLAAVNRYLQIKARGQL